MRIRVVDGLPYITASLTFQRQNLTFEKVILDTGSTGTLFSADKLVAIGLLPEPQDSIHRVWGVRGAEFIFTKRVGCLSLGELKANDFEIDLEGIVGLDFLMRTGAIIDLARLEIGGQSHSGDS